MGSGSSGLKDYQMVAILLYLQEAVGPLASQLLTVYKMAAALRGVGTQRRPFFVAEIETGMNIQQYLKAWYTCREAERLLPEVPEVAEDRQRLEAEIREDEEEEEEYGTEEDWEEQEEEKSLCSKIV